MNIDTGFPACAGNDKCKSQMKKKHNFRNLIFPLLFGTVVCPLSAGLVDGILNYRSEADAADLLYCGALIKRAARDGGDGPV